MRLVLIEGDARWPVLASTHSTETMVIAQGSGEYEAFAARVVRKLGGLAVGRLAVRSALLAVSPRAAPQGLDARIRLARAVVAHMNATGGGALALYAEPSSDGSVRHALMGLVDGLVSENGSESVTISFQVGPESSRAPGRSGTRLRRVLGT
jgi:hypothetical protein